MNPWGQRPHNPITSQWLDSPAGDQAFNQWAILENTLYPNYNAIFVLTVMMWLGTFFGGSPYVYPYDQRQKQKSYSANDVLGSPRFIPNASTEDQLFM
jgi:hypothetical protein